VPFEDSHPFSEIRSLENENLANEDLRDFDFTDVRTFGFTGQPRALPLNYRLRYSSGQVIFGPKVDLSGIKFEGLDLRHLNLESVNFEAAIFHSCNFSSANLKSTCLTNTVFLNCVFDGAHFDYAEMENTEFESCSFFRTHGSYVVGVPHKLPPTWQITNQFLYGDTSVIEDQVIQGLDIVGAKLEILYISSSSINDFVIQDSIIKNLIVDNKSAIQGGEISQSEVTNISFYKSIVTDFKFGRSLIAGEIAGCQIRNIDLTNRNLAGLNIRRSQLINVDFSGSHWRYENATPVLTTSGLTHSNRANLPSLYFDGCIFNRTVFINSDLTESKFRNCIFVETDFRYANCRSARFSQCEFVDENTEGTYWGHGGRLEGDFPN